MLSEAGQRQMNAPSGFGLAGAKRFTVGFELDLSAY